MARLFRYVAFGDSTAVGVGASSGGGYPERIWQRLRGTGVNAGLLNLGESGATAADLLETQLARRIAAAELVTVGIGSNDLWRLTAREDFRATLESIAQRLVHLKAPVIVCNLIDLSHAPAARWALPSLGVPGELLSARVRDFDAELAEMSTRHRFQLCDIHALGEAELRNAPDYFSSDGFHPSAKGYARWAEVLWEQVKPVSEAWAASEASPLS